MAASTQCDIIGSGSEPEAEASATSCKNDKDYLTEGATSFAYQMEHERKINSGFEMAVEAVQVKQIEAEAENAKKEAMELTLKGCCEEVLNKWEHSVVALRKELEENERRHSEMTRVYFECLEDLKRLYEDFDGSHVFEHGPDLELIIRQLHDQQSVMSLLESGLENMHAHEENTKAKFQDMWMRIRKFSAVEPPTDALEILELSKNVKEQPKSDVDTSNATGLLPTSKCQDSDDDDNVEYDAASISPEYNQNFYEGASNELQWAVIRSRVRCFFGGIR